MYNILAKLHDEYQRTDKQLSESIRKQINDNTIEMLAGYLSALLFSIKLVEKELGL